MTEPRQCIKCRSPQERIVVLEVEIDRCSQCGGIWLDGGEIEQLNDRRKTHATADVEDAIVRLAKGEPAAATPVVPSGTDVVDATPCPACAGKLTNVNFHGTSIEQCNGCHGVFVDRGELQRAMDLVDSNEATTIMALAGSVTTSGSIG